MAFVLVYLGIGVVTAIGLMRWNWLAYKRWEDPSFLDGWILEDFVIGGGLWWIALLDREIRETVFEGLGEDA